MKCAESIERRLPLLFRCSLPFRPTIQEPEPPVLLPFQPHSRIRIQNRLLFQTLKGVILFMFYSCLLVHLNTLFW